MRAGGAIRTCNLAVVRYAPDRGFELLACLLAYCYCCCCSTAERETPVRDGDRCYLVMQLPIYHHNITSSPSLFITKSDSINNLPSTSITNSAIVPNFLP